MWNEMAKGIWKVVKETLGDSTGFGPKGKDFWWRDNSLQQKIKVKSVL